MTDQLGVTDRRKRIVDLQVKQVLDAAATHVIQCAAFGERGDRPAVAVRTEKEAVLLGEQQPARGRVNGRHRPLAKHEYIVFVQSEPLMLG